MGWADDKDLTPWEGGSGPWAKNPGPWPFVERGDVYGYLNNKRWSSQADAIAFCQAHGLPLDLPNQHLPCGHWHKEYAPTPSKVPAVTGRWVAAMSQHGTPYIYLYDIAYRAVIKLDTSANPITLVEIFLISATYDLDYDREYGVPGSQRGGYCMNKSGTRIWYLFRDDSLGSAGNCELIEVDISGPAMVKVGSTIFPALVYYEMANPEYINDGCSDDTHTYWCTENLAGRLLKIRNSDHSIVSDHSVNNPDANEAIHTLDISSNHLYWSYCIGRAGFNACQKLIRSNLAFSVEIDDEICGVGFSTPWWQNWIRVVSGCVLHHRAYYPNIGNLYRRDLSCVQKAVSSQEYLTNILGSKGGKLFILQHDNVAGVTPFRLRCLDFSTLAQISEQEVSYYCGYNYPTHYDWGFTATSAMNEQTGVIIIVRYPNTEAKNYVACFGADSSLNLICDERMDYVITEEGGNEEIISDEPQVWTMPG